MSDRKLISSGSPFEKTYGYSRAVVSADPVRGFFGKARRISFFPAPLGL